jgi:aminoglycoside phosphotransferase (APT) family kinase protein
MTGTAAQQNEPGLAAIEAALRTGGMIGEAVGVRFTTLTGGVASDIWKVETGGTTFVVKRALPKLRVAADWYAPVDRNLSEAAWLRVAKRIVPHAAPDVLFEDTASAMFAMNYFPPDLFPVWKAELRDGRVDLAFAAAVGRTVARIHQGTAEDETIAQAFANDAAFHAIRLEPYLEATASRHPDLASRLFALSRTTLSCHHALIHGDVSPKNILVGTHGPVLLDAECACYGDPAFDLAFCLNHLLLKGLWNRPVVPRFLAAFDALVEGYFQQASFEPRVVLEQRTAALLPALFLARVDGKSPVEYIVDEADRDLVRRTAAPLIRNPPDDLQAIRMAWAEAVNPESRGH